MKFIKQKKLNRWFWRWHIIAGLMCLPVMLLLSVTGILYLFKADYNHLVYQDILQVDAPKEMAASVSYQTQLENVQRQSDHPVMQVFLPETREQTTGFRLHNHGHSRHVVYTDPYTGEVLGGIQQKQTLMYKIRKLHGEILLDTPGTLIVELVASWFVVLILTGIYIWWPAKTFSLAGFFTVRCNGSRRMFWRDMHAVFGFWLSIFMLVILAGGMPWTDVFGKNIKWVQEQTNTGYPEHWRSSKGVQSAENSQTTISLDKVAEIAQERLLKGQVSIKLPVGADGIFSITNRSFWLSDQKVVHVDQYSGEVIKALNWQDVGFLMDLRQVAMRLHQGEYGRANWYAVLLITLLFTVSTAAGFIAYLIRKPKGRWGFPEVPNDFKVGYFILSLITLLGVLFPLFGVSLIAISLYDYLMNLRKDKVVAGAVK